MVTVINHPAKGRLRRSVNTTVPLFFPSEEAAAETASQHHKEGAFQEKRHTGTVTEQENESITETRE